MSLYTEASIIITPNAVKEDKLYAIKPGDGSGDLVVTRATTATRVNSDGLIEVTPYNLTTYSEQFDNAAWVKTAINITANSSTSPDGTTTADKFIPTSATSLHIAESSLVSFVSGTTYTFSFYGKKAENNFIQFTASSALLGIRANFDLNSGVLGTVDSGITATITSIGSDGWYRCTATFTASVTGSYRIVLTAITNSIAGRFQSFAGNNVDGLFLWGTQLVTGTSAKEYFPTTDRLDVPRLDYTNSSCPSILVEPQRTNLALYSEQFDNAVWAKTRATVVSNATIAPDGNLTADKLIPSIDNNTHILQQSNISVTAQIYSATVYAKKGEYDTVRLLLANLWTPNPNAIFNLTTKSIVSTQNVTAKITELTNGWFKLEITSTINPFPGSNGQLLIYGGNNGLVNFAGDGTSGVFIWGAQIEAGSNATSYVPTVASSVTRNADVISKTGISSLIGQTEGTMFVDFNLAKTPSDANGRLLQLWATSDTTNAIIPILNQSNQLQISMFKDSTGNAVIPASSSTLLSLGRNKIAVAYTSTTLSVYRNGVLFATGNPTTVFPSSLNSLNLGCSSFANRSLENTINSAILFKTRLTDTELAQLTTI